MEISFFNKITQTENPSKTSIDSFLNSVKLGTWKAQVDEIRSHSDPALIAEKKRNLPYVTISGEFSKRNNDGLIRHSGFICIDIDKIENTGELFGRVITDQFVYAAFRSASGNGIAIVIKIDPKKHLDSFLGLEKYFADKFEVMIDKSCKDVSRPRFVSYDPDCQINPHAETFKIYLKKDDKKRTPVNAITGQNDINHILEQIQRRAIDLTHSSYFRFLEIGFAIGSEFGEAGRDIFHCVVQNSIKYNREKADRQYTNCLKSNNSGITIATFYHFCKEEGISIITEATRRMTTISAIAKKSGRGVFDAVRILTEIEGFDKEEAKEIAEKVFNNDEIGKENTLGKLDQIEQFLLQNYDLKRNEITRFVENTGKEIDSTFSNSVYIRLRKLVDDSIKFEEVDKLIHSDFTADYNPLKEFFEKRKEIDCDGEIDRFIECLDSPTGLEAGTLFPEYKKVFFKKWLVGLVASIFDKHSPLCLVLTGGQNTGKTEFFRRLLPSELFPYYAESKLDAGKDDEILMTQKILILDDEFGGKSKLESKRFKELTSKQYFTLREPYGRKNVRLRRMAVLAGTSNETEILNDPTGNRRIIPLEVNRIDFEKYNSCDKVKLLCDAYKLLISGFQYELTKDEIKALNRNTAGFEQVRAEKELVISYIKLPEYQPNGIGIRYMQTTEIKDYIEKQTQQKINIYKLSQELKALGFEQMRRKINGLSSRVWAVVLPERNEIEQEEVVLFGKSNDLDLPF